MLNIPGTQPQEAESPGWDRSGSPLISRPCPPPPPGILPPAQLLGWSQACALQSPAHTHTYTCEKCENAVMWKHAQNTCPEAGPLYRKGHSASSPLAEPQVRPIHHKTSVSCENALRAAFCSPDFDPCLTNLPTQSQIKPCSGAATSRPAEALLGFLFCSWQHRRLCCPCNGPEPPAPGGQQSAGSGCCSMPSVPCHFLIESGPQRPRRMWKERRSQGPTGPSSGQLYLCG